MNTKLKIIQSGIFLLFATLSIFFLLYFLFSTKGSISDAQYFNYSALISCFLLPALFAGVGFYTSYSEAKKRILNFAEVFKLTFMPMFIGGIGSLSAIFVFFNTIGSWAEDALQRGWHDLMTAQPNPEFMEKNGEMVKAMTNLEINMFTTKVFLISSAVIVLYYFMISIIFAIFLKNRKV